MAKLSLKAARQNLRGAAREGERSILAGAEFAADHLSYAIGEVSELGKSDRESFKEDIAATSTAVGGLAFRAARAKLQSKSEMKSLMAAEKKLMRLVGLKPPPGFTRTPADPSNAPRCGRTDRAQDEAR